MAMYEGSLNGAGLRDIMRDYLLPTAKEHFGEGAEWWLLHDNDPGRHKSIVVRTWMHNNSVRPLDFRPYSPDLNPIENLWADVKKRTEQKQAGTKEELEQLLSEEWAATSPALCNTLARSMVHRIEQVIDAMVHTLTIKPCWKLLLRDLGGAHAALPRRPCLQQARIQESHRQWIGARSRWKENVKKIEKLS
jgi:transposase